MPVLPFPLSDGPSIMDVEEMKKMYKEARKKNGYHVTPALPQPSIPISGTSRPSHVNPPLPIS